MNPEPPVKPKWIPRLAREEDIPVLEKLVRASVLGLQAPYYSLAQMEAALGPVFGVDKQLIRDGTYFVVAIDSQIIGCGGWSKRKSLYGGDAARKDLDPELNPESDPARVRAFFVDPDWARKGVARSILAECEQAIRKAGFQSVEIVATVVGEPLYVSFGYTVTERYDIILPNGLGLPAVRLTKKL